MNDSINGVISALLRATPRESGKGIDHNLHIAGMNIKLGAEKRLQNDKILYIIFSHCKTKDLVGFFFFSLLVLL